jgi:anti-anti-sigma factor
MFEHVRQESSGGLVIERSAGDDGVVLRLDGELDLATVSQFDAEIAEIARAAPPHVLIDLARVTFMDSTGLASIIRAHRAAASAGCTLAFRSGSDQVQRLLKLTGTIDFLTFEEDGQADEVRGACCGP